MDKVEATKFLALIKVAYPTSYRDLDKTTTQATINMWKVTFSDVPFDVMVIAFEHFRRVSKFPPTVAEICEELKKIYYTAYADYIQCSNKNSWGIGAPNKETREEKRKKAKYIMDCTEQFEKIETSININYDSIKNKQIDAYYNQKLLGE